MRLTLAHCRDAALVGVAGLIAFTAIRVMYLMGYDSPFMPGAISLIVVALWIFLLGRYRPRPQLPVDPRRQRIWFLSGLAGCAALAVFGLVALLWLRVAHPEPSVPCPAQSSVNAAPSGDKIAGAAVMRCHQSS